LVIYSGRSESLVAPLIEMFAAESGINVEVRYGGTAEMAATLLEEGEASPADIFYAQDPGGLGAVAEAGLLAELPDSLLSQVPAEFADPNGQWLGVSGRARVVVYNTDVLSPADLPEDLQGFTDPAWSGRLGIAPSNGSWQIMVTALRQVWGEEATRAWLEAIVANEPTYYENNTAIVAAVGAGEVDAGFVNHYYLYRFLAEEGEGFPARNYFLPSGGPGSLVMVSGAGMLATAPNSANAQAFLEFLLSEQAQTYFRDETAEYPVAAGVTPAEGLTPLAELNSIEIELASLADLQGTVALLQETGMLP
jgi:iron(III) transport system substrate-binding protein